MTEKQINPLICDPETGMCEVPGLQEKDGKGSNGSRLPAVRVLYFTDPICSACWSIEPQLRKLQMEYGDQFYIEYHMGGLLPSWEVYNQGPISKPSDVAHHWEEMSSYFDMPIDGDVWITDPLSSSYPPCVAVKAAELQGVVKGANFLRRIREMVFLEKKNITRWEYLKMAAVECGLDTAQFSTDYYGSAQQLFKDDLGLASHHGVRGFPALYFSDSLNNQTTIYGYKPYEDFEMALKKLCPDLKKRKTNITGSHLFLHYSTLTSKEFAVLTSLSKEEAERTLSELHQQGKIEKFQSKNGALWKRKGMR
jgi:predicted DsbA family dithiol-disulfide isomerase